MILHKVTTVLHPTMLNRYLAFGFTKKNKFSEIPPQFVIRECSEH